ncbi:MAG: TetR/AcrR family transcriptional regulator [Candidatus Binataceae bacterium]
MRVSKEKVEQNRQQLLSAAARLFREQGIEATGVDAITERAGLTHGSLYSQFGSKEAVTAEAILFASTRSKRAWQGPLEDRKAKPDLRGVVERYLTPAHRDAPGHGCVIAALGADIARQPRVVRHAFTKALKGAIDVIAELMPEKDREEKAIAAFGAMVGALILSRAVDDEALSELILKAAAERVIDLADGPKRVRRS